MVELQSAEPVTLEQVDALRQFWIDALNSALNARKKARKDAESLPPDNPLRLDLNAYADERAFNAEMQKAGYEDAARRLEIQVGHARDALSERLAKTNTMLAKSQTFIAAVVAAFTIVQVVLAIIQAVNGGH